MRIRLLALALALAAVTAPSTAMAADRVVQVGEDVNDRGRRVQVVDVPRAPGGLF